MLRNTEWKPTGCKGQANDTSWLIHCHLNASQIKRSLPRFFCFFLKIQIERQRGERLGTDQR